MTINRSGWIRCETGIYERADGKGRKEPFLWKQRVKGKRYYETFETLEEAVARKESVFAQGEKYGDLARQFDERDWRELSMAREVLEPAGVSVLDACRFYMERHRRDGRTVAEFVEHYLKWLRDNNAGARNQESSKTWLKMLCLGLGDRRPAEVTTGDVLELLGQYREEGLAPRTLKNYRTAWNTFFRFLVDLDFARENPVEKVTRFRMPKVKRVSRKHPMEVWQVVDLMAFMDRERPKWAFWMALQFFLGVREAESRRFRYEWCDPKRRVVVVPGWFFDEDSKREVQGSKTEDFWMIERTPANFWAWLEAHGKASGQVEAPRWEPFRKQLQRKGIIGEWPHNCRRDSFCTYHMSAFGDAGLTSKILKHRRRETLWESYMGSLRTEAEGRAYFGIYPGISKFPIG